jgi:hypothetical protein
VSGGGPGGDAGADAGAAIHSDSGRGVWVVTVRADREYHELVLARQGPDTAAAVAPGDFPADQAPREVVLRGEEVRIGRGGEPPRSTSAARPATRASRTCTPCCWPCRATGGW